MQSNIWKYFIYNVSHRRNFYPILAIFFLTLPNTNAQQIGIYVGIGYLFSFLLEIPSGYISDKFGHKKTLVLTKIFALISLLLFIFADSLIYFILGSIFLSLQFAFKSGTDSAFMHNTLTALKRERDFTKVMSRISGNSSLVSAIMIILLPLLTTYSLKLPLQIYLIVDIIGLIAVLSLVSPVEKFDASEVTIKSAWNLAKKEVGTGFYATTIFLGLITGMAIGSTPFREPYLTSLGFPVIFIGSVMGLSRLFWFFVGHKAHIIEEKWGLKKLFKVEMFLFPLLLILIAVFNNPYVVGLIFLAMVGYHWGRYQIIISVLLNSFVKNPRYKATMISIKSQITAIFKFIVAVGIGYVMKESFKEGYLMLGVGLFVALFIAYQSIDKLKEKRRDGKIILKV